VLGRHNSSDTQPAFIPAVEYPCFELSASAIILRILRQCLQANDFGGEIIPWAANDGYKVQAYLFNDYWEDIGTIKSFFEANLALAAQVRPR